MKPQKSRGLILLILFTSVLIGSIAEPKTFADNILSFLSSTVSRSGEFSIPSKRDEGSGSESFRQLSLASTQSFIQRRLFNTSVALTVPLFSFTLPQTALQGSTVDLANQAIFGLFGLLVTMLVFAVPVLFTGVRPTSLTGRSDSGGTQGILNHLMSSTPVFNFMGADLQHKIGLDSTKCLQKTICEAHRSPRNKHYGLLALPFQIFFPPPSNHTSEERSSAFQLAARNGKYSSVECGEKFHCFFDILDLATYLLEWYQFSSRIPEDNKVKHSY